MVGLRARIVVVTRMILVAIVGHWARTFILLAPNFRVRKLECRTDAWTPFTNEKGRTRARTTKYVV